MSDLRERIAAAIRSDDLVRVSVETSLRFSDAVIAELNLKPERSFTTWDDSEPILIRFVTDWKADDE